MIKPETYATAARVLSAALPVLSLKREAAWKAYVNEPSKAALYFAALLADQELKAARAEYTHALNRAANAQAAGRAVK